MRLTTAMLLALATFTPAVASEQRATCDKSFHTNFRSSGILKLLVRSGDIEIAGSDSQTVSVTCVTEHVEDQGEISIVFESSGANGTLRVNGGPMNNVRIRIEVPRRTHLQVRVPAGDVEISGVTGDKDVALRAGDLTINVGDPSEYATVEASVNAGDLHASAFGIHKGGLFRSIRRTNTSGAYTLRAKLWAGDVKLR